MINAQNLGVVTRVTNAQMSPAKLCVRKKNGDIRSKT
jgi:hypothetical protein